MDSHLLYNHINEIVDLDEQEFQEVLSNFKPVYRNKHEYIVQSGYDINYEFFVIGGCLKSSVFDTNGKEHVIQFATENWWITDYQAFLHKEKSTLDIYCLEDCQLLAISYEDKETLTSAMPKMEKFWSTKARFGYAALQNRILSLIQDSAKERYDKLLSQYPHLLQRVPKKYIASYLGVTRETLSRLNK